MYLSFENISIRDKLETDFLQSTGFYLFILLSDTGKTLNLNKVKLSLEEPAIGQLHCHFNLNLKHLVTVPFYEYQQGHDIVTC